MGEAVEVIENLYLGPVSDIVTHDDVEVFVDLSGTVNADIIVGEAKRSGKIRHAITQDDGVAVVQETWDEFRMIMEEHWTEGKRVGVGCGAGISRSPAFVIGWMVAHQGWSWDNAEDYIRRVYPHAQPHPSIRSSLLKILGEDYKPIGVEE